jgi:dsDNA-specific endonuclease/ATPase MutS2
LEQALNAPVPHRQRPKDQEQANRQALLALEPGEELYIIPFRKQGRLIRFNDDGNTALVASGVFEVQLPLADLEPVKG